MARGKKAVTPVWTDCHGIISIESGKRKNHPIKREVTHRMQNELITQAAAMLRSSQTVVAMTGAGIGKPSGIPDFRSESGLWSKDDPMEAASIYTFQSNPQRFYDWLRPLMDLMLAAKPNPAHQALVQLEQRGLLQSVITQNIDGLHQEAGSQMVYELHGHIRSATCSQCKQTTFAEPLIEPIHAGNVPTCPACGGVYKPDIVLFGEPLPQTAFVQAHLALEACDALIIAGTSLAVHPAGSLPIVAARKGAKIIIVNIGETELDDIAHVIINADVAQALPAIVEAI
jgi:NAD-dependent deacetylase